MQRPVHFAISNINFKFAQRQIKGQVRFTQREGSKLQVHYAITGFFPFEMYQLCLIIPQTIITTEDQHLKYEVKTIQRLQTDQEFQVSYQIFDLVDYSLYGNFNNILNQNITLGIFSSVNQELNEKQEKCQKLLYHCQIIECNQYWNLANESGVKIEESIQQICKNHQQKYSMDNSQSIIKLIEKYLKQKLLEIDDLQDNIEQTYLIAITQSADAFGRYIGNIYEL